MGYTCPATQRGASIMPKRTRLLIRSASVVSALCVIWIVGDFPLTPAQAQQTQQGTAPQAVPVGIVPAERKPIARASDFVGRVEAINRVEIRARVTGYLERSCSRKATDQGRRSPVPDREGPVRGRGGAGPGSAGAQQGRAKS